MSEKTIIAPEKPGELAGTLDQMVALMRGMADMIRATNERMAALETSVRQLEKVTPGQASEICRSIRNRAEEICDSYRMPGLEKPVATAIRRTVRAATGSRSTQGIARCDFAPVMEIIRDWDEYRTVKRIKERGSAD